MYILSIIYSLIIKLRNYLYDHKILQAKSVDGVEIICIGNITVGGTGKTPAVEYFANKFLVANKKVVLISRGYKGKRDYEPLIVSDGNSVISNVEEAGDEAFMNAQKLKIPIIVSKNRYKGAILAAEKYAPDIILLDDGFQHRKLKRDKDIVLIDATNPFDNERCLPAGKLREPISGLSRAHDIIITKTNFASKSECDLLLSRLKKFKKKLYTAEYVGVEFFSKNRNKYKTDIINGKKVFLFSGIATPENFKKSIKKFNPEKIKNLSFKDHYKYCYKDIEMIINEYTELGFDYIITTEKDFVKLSNIMDDDSFFWKKLLIIKMELKLLEEI